MAHEVETMAYANETPWHKLGVPVDSSISVDDMLIAAGLNWEVELRPVFTADDAGNPVAIPNKRALVRKTDNKPLTIAGPNWTPVQNRDAMEFFREYTESGGATLETAGSLRGGKLVWGLARINQDFEVKGRQNDVTKGYILLSSHHEAGYRTKVRTTATRVVCANTFAMAERDAVSYSQTHTSAFDTAKAKDSIQLAMNQIAQMERDANIMAQKEISEFDAARFYARLLQPVKADEVEENHVWELLASPADRNVAFYGAWDSYMNAPGAEPGTFWGVFNGMTHWADHTAGGRDDSARVDSAWFGRRGKLKQQAYTQLMEMAA